MGVDGVGGSRDGDDAEAARPSVPGQPGKGDASRGSGPLPHRVPGQASAPRSPEGAPLERPATASPAPAAPGPAAAAEQVPPQRERPGGPEGDAAPSDTELVARVRGGADGAYEVLYRRHADAVRRYARGCCRDAHTAEDLTGEVFARTLQAIRGGSGPDAAVRAYLLTTVRRVAASWGRTARREQLVEDFAAFAVAAAGDAAGRTSVFGTGADPGADVSAMREAERSLAVRAFRTLPERWQAVLWHTAVEEESPSEVAPLLGLSANATAVLAHRAREGLRQAYLQAHVSASLTSGGDCARYADRLGAHTRGALRLRADRELRRHLDECAGCRAAAADLADVNACLKGLLPVATVGWFAAGYAVKAAAGAAVAGAAGAGAATAGASGPAGAAGGWGGGGGAPAGEGIGLTARIGVAAGVAAAAASVALTATLLGAGTSAPKPVAEPPAAAPPVAIRPHPAPPPPPRAAPRPRPPRPVEAPPHAAHPAPAPRPAPPPPRPAPSTPAPRSQPEPKPKPEHRLNHTRRPSPQPPQAAAPTVYELDSLPFGGPYGALGGDRGGPTIRPSAADWMWRHWGLSVDGTAYRDSVTVRAPSSVVVDLNRACTSYDAPAGMDDLSLDAGAVRFLVYGGGTLLYRSGVVRGGDPAVPVHADLTGHRTPRLVVQRADRGGLVDVADWARSRINCRQAARSSRSAASPGARARPASQAAR